MPLPTPATSLRWQADAPHSPLHLAEMPEAGRDPAPGEVRLRVAACGLNHADLLMLAGRYQDQPDPPIVPGLELSGRIEAVGAGVAGLAPGMRVAAFAGADGLAQIAHVPAASCRQVPDAMALDLAASFQIVYGTAHLALVHRAGLRAGERLVVSGATGGSGLAAVEIGRLTGAEIVALARGADKLAVARAAGAHHLICSATGDIRAEVKALGGADVVFDTVGGEVWDALFRAARPEARLLPIGFAGGEVPQIKANHLLVKNLTVIGLYWGGYLRFAPDILADSLARIMGWIAAGELRLHIGARFPFAQAPDALAALKAREVTGKIVVTMPGAETD